LTNPHDAAKNSSVIIRNTMSINLHLPEKSTLQLYSRSGSKEHQEALRLVKKV
jgi:hypothetical protein